MSLGDETWKETCCGFQFAKEDLTLSCHFFSQDFCIPKTQQFKNDYSNCHWVFYSVVAQLSLASNCLFFSREERLTLIYWRKNIYADYYIPTWKKKKEKWIQKDNALLMLIHLSSFLARFFSKAVNSVLRLFECQSNGLVITTKNHLQKDSSFR